VTGQCGGAASALRYVALASHWTRTRPDGAGGDARTVLGGRSTSPFRWQLLAPREVQEQMDALLDSPCAQRALGPHG
jgi:hypothetical protein